MAGSSGLSDVLREMAEGRRSRPRPESAEARREPSKDDVPRQKPRHSPPPSAAQAPASPAASGPKPAPSKPRVEASKPATKPAKPPVAKAPPPPQPPAKVVEDDEEVLIAEVDEPVAPVAARHASSQATPAPTRTPAPASGGRRRAPAAPAQTSTLKEIGACLFTTISLLMLVVAIWGTLVLMDFEIWRYDQPGAQTMAKMSQVFYLLAIVGLAYSVWLFVQIAAEKKKAATNRKKR